MLAHPHTHTHTHKPQCTHRAKHANLEANHGVWAWVGLPMGQTGARNAEFGRIWPLEPGVRVALLPAHTRTHTTLIFAHTGFINGAGYFNRLLQPTG